MKEEPKSIEEVVATLKEVATALSSLEDPELEDLEAKIKDSIATLTKAKSQLFGGLAYIEKGTFSLGQKFDKLMGSQMFKKIMNLPVNHERGPYKTRKERPCKRCYGDTKPEDLPDTFHTTLSCPVIGYNRVFIPI
jgi:hypothetical protein